jgi:hypothetical protein
MYCIELNVLKWTYETTLEAYHNKHLQIRLLCPPMYLGNAVITGIRTYEEFKHYLDAGAVLQYHSMRVDKVDNIRPVEG